MAKAKNPNTPLSNLDKAILKLILQEARKLVADGMSPHDAARQVCHGSWSDFESYVLEELKRGEGDA